ncbi:hypothetical protein D3C86_1330580 [compost metagenome]
MQRCDDAERRKHAIGGNERSLARTQGALKVTRQVVGVAVLEQMYRLPGRVGAVAQAVVGALVEVDGVTVGRKARQRDDAEQIAGAEVHRVVDIEEAACLGFGLLVRARAEAVVAREVRAGTELPQGGTSGVQQFGGSAQAQVARAAEAQKCLSVDHHQRPARRLDATACHL